MAKEIALISVVVMILTGSALVLVLFSSKRPELPWGRFLLAGPFLVINPEWYVRATRVPWVPRIATLFILLFLLAAVSSAIAEAT